MRLLLDTHAAAWWWLGDPKMPASVREAISGAHEVYFSAVCVFEFATKHRIGKWPAIGTVLARLNTLMDEARFVGLPLNVNHAAAAGAYQIAHGDPFDRLLVAQAQIEGLTVVTADRAFAQFAVPLLWTGTRQ